MPLADTHAHLTSAVFKGQLDAVITRAKAAGVAAINCSGVNRPTNEEVLTLARKYPMIKASLGLYPIDLIGLPKEADTGLAYQQPPIDLDEELKFIHAHRDKIVSVGEVGLDYKWSTKEEEHKLQKQNFEKIISFAEKIGKPIVVHSRKAEEDCVNMLASSKIKKVQLHVFEGRKHLIKRAADLGFYFSIPCIILKLQHFQMLAEMVDIKQLLTETDAPWLSPFPGKPNEPAFIAETIKKIAEIKKMKPEDVEERLWENYGNMFLR